MKVSELVTSLQRYQQQHGNQEVIDSYDTPIAEPEEVDGYCVLAEKA